MICPKYGFSLISGFDAYVVEFPADIQLGKILGSAELGDKLRDEREWVPVLDHYKVQGMIVLYQLEGTVLLFDKEDQYGYG